MPEAAGAWPWEQTVGLWLLTYLIHSTLLLGCVWLFSRIPLPRSNALRETLWKAALTGGVLTASISVLWPFQPLTGRIELTRLNQPVFASPKANQDESRILSVQGPSGMRLRMETWIDDGASASGRKRSLRMRGSVQSPDVGGSDRVRRFEIRRDLGTSTLGPSPPMTTEPPASSPGPAPSKLFNGHDFWDLQRPESLRLRRFAVPESGGVFEYEFRQGLLPRLTELLVDESTPVGVSWLNLLVYGWIGMGALLTLRLLWTWRGLGRRLRERRPCQGAMIELLERLRQRCGFRRPVRLSVSDRLFSPLVLGRSEICIPRRAVEQLETGAQESLLAHELAHVVRADGLWFLWSAFLSGIFFFQPLNRLASRCLRREAEYLCDDWAVQQTGKGRSLAFCLTEVAGWIEDSAQPAAVPGMAGDESVFCERVRRLCDESRRPGKAAIGLRSTLAFLLMMTGLGLAPGVSLTSADPATQPHRIILMLNSGDSKPAAPTRIYRL